MALEPVSLTHAESYHVPIPKGDGMGSRFHGDRVFVDYHRVQLGDGFFRKEVGFIYNPVNSDTVRDGFVLEGNATTPRPLSPDQKTPSELIDLLRNNLPSHVSALFPAGRDAEI